MGIKSLGKYHLWSGNESRRLLRSLKEEEFKIIPDPLLGSIRDKIEHIILAIESCFNQISDKSSSFEEIVNRLKSMSNKELLDHWESRDTEIANALQQENQGKVTIQRMDTSSFILNLDDFYLQYILHTVYHRGQLNYILRKMNRERIDADYLFYFDELNIQENNL
ncbi:MAG: DinB family protein [Promethearchaeota archaeon]